MEVGDRYQVLCYPVFVRSVIIGMTSPGEEKKTMKALRIAAGLTQQELAMRLGVSIGAVRSWDSGRSFPHLSPASMAKLVAELGIDLDTLAAVESASDD